MSDTATPADAGKVTDPSIVDTLEKNVRALVRMSAVLVRLSERIDALEEQLDVEEGRADALDDPAEHGDPEPDNRPALAWRCDGRALLLLTQDLLNAGVHTGRETWLAIVMTESETADALEHLEDGMSEAAGTIGGWLVSQAKKGGEGS